MHLMIDKGKYGHNTLYVYKSYRNENGKSTSKCVERLGRYDELAKVHEDPVAWAKEYIAELNRQEKEKTKTVMLPLSPVQQIEQNKQVLFDGGYLFLKHIYHQLNLDYICKKISSQYNFKYNLNEIMQTLVFNRILFPCSKYATYEKAKHSLEPPKFSLKDMYRSLGVIAKTTDIIQSDLYKFSKEVSKRNDHILYYDCTNFYCEIEEEKGIRKYGISKENRPNPIVQMGLFLDGDGIPLAFCVSAGNTNEQTTLKPLEKQIMDDFNLSKFIVCTDAGLSSVANRKFNNYGDKAFVTTQSIKKMKAFQKDWVFDRNGWKTTGSTETFNLDELLSSEEKITQYYDKIFFKERWFNEDGLEQRYIVSFSIKYMDYQRKVRNEQVLRAEKAMKHTCNLEKNRQTDYKRFIQKITLTDEGEVVEKKSYSLDYDKINDEAQYDGFYAVATNLEGCAEKIIEINKGRWEIEESFRFMKDEFDTRPIYLSKDEHIKAHFTTCFLALTVFRYLEKIIKEKYTGQELLKELREFKFYRVQSEGYMPVYERTELIDMLHENFGFHTDMQIIPTAEMKNIFSKIKNCHSHTTP